MSKKGHFMPCNDGARWERCEGISPYMGWYGGGGRKRGEMRGLEGGKCLWRVFEWTYMMYCVDLC